MDDIASAAKTAAWDWVTTFRAPRFIDISDVRLGASNRAFQILVLVYFILIMAISKEYEIKYTPKGSTQYYISAGSMYTQMNDAASESLCSNAAAGAYDYTDADCKAGDQFWCESDIGCYNPTSYEASIKAGQVAWIYTYVKDTTIVKNKCATLSQTYCDLTLRGSYYKRYVDTFQPAEDICGCELYENYFMKGVEGMRVTVAHSYNVDTLGKSETNVLTRVRGPGHATTAGRRDDDYKTFGAGDNVVLTVGDFLSIAGLAGLDERHQYAMDLYPSEEDAEYLIYRMTGLEINLDFQYVGSVGGDIPGGSNVECILTVSMKEGYSSKGNEVGYDYDSYPSSARLGTDFHDRYYRGIKMTMSSGGVIGSFDFFNLIVVFTSVSILLSFSATIVSMIAYSLLGYTSHVYDHFGQQKLRLRRLHAKIAGQALIAGKVWSELITPDTEERVGVEQFTQAFLKQGYSRNDAQELAIALLSSKHDDEDPGVEAINEALHTMGMMSKVEKKAEEPMSGSSKASAVRAVHKEYALAKVKDDTMDFYHFCDLLSEEQTTLYAAMGRPEDGDVDSLQGSDHSNSSDELAPTAVDVYEP